MPALDDITIPLEPGCGYHIFNRGNEGRLLFFKEKNYQYFLDKYQAYMSGFWNTYAYCLLPNHFHLAIGVKNQDEVIRAGRDHFSKVSKGFLKEHWPRSIDLTEVAVDYDRLSNRDYLLRYLPETAMNVFLYQLAVWTVTERFRRFLLGYAKAINVQEMRHGSLFQKLFRRKRIPKGFSRSLIAYIHRNPVHHGYCNSMQDYTWSSFLALSQGETCWLDRPAVMTHFGSDAEFQSYHRDVVDEWLMGRALVIEE